MSLTRLEQVRRLVAAHGGGELADWFNAGCVRRENGESLDRALELCGPRATAARDAAIRRAARLLDPEGRRGPWALAGDLAALINRFEGGRWRTLRGEHEPKLSPLQRAIFDAFTTADTAGQPMLTSQRRIYDAIRD